MLLPVRLETRYGEGDDGPELRVRIFPDQISIDTHETALTGAEEEAGHAYWDALWGLTGDEAAAADKAAWQGLAAAYGPERAAWIANRTTPMNADERASAAEPEFPDLPAADRKEAAWERAPLARGLPDYWVVAGYADGAEVARATSEPVRRPLAVGPDPSLEPPADEAELQVDDGMRWMIDFDEALAAGMAVRMPLTASQRDRGFDALIAVGLTSTRQASGILGAAAVPDELGHAGPVIAELLTAHRHTGGLALVPKGAPTNNTEQAKAAHSREDPGFERSYRAERGEPVELADGRLAALALGVPEDAFQHVEHADRADVLNARLMALALWPATLGYFLHDMMWPVFDRDDRDAAHRWFVETVCAGGPLPALRTGDTPYGILPVTSLASWDPQEPSELERGLATFLQRLLPVWLRSTGAVPRVGRPESDPDQELVDILTMDASSRSYRGRPALGDEFIDATFRFLQIGQEFLSPSPVGRDLLDLYGYADWNPRVTRVSLADRSYELARPLVHDGPLSETEPLPSVDWQGGTANYISWLGRAPVADVRDELFPGGAPETLLYAVLRQAVLREYADIAFQVHIMAGTMTEADTVEPELVDFPGRGDLTTTAFWALETPPGALTDGRTVSDYIDALPDRGVGPATHLRDVPDPFLPVRRLRLALDRLAGLPTAELERLFTETLDATSHRLDAWITSLAFEPLRRRSAAAEEAGVTPPLHLGGYGFVVDLEPGPAREPVSGDERAAVDALDAARAERVPDAPEPPSPLDPGDGSGGFVHAPTLGHAAAAAVLRSGYLTHRARGDGEPLAIDLSSERVRTALSLLEGVRDGQPLAALLGARFERGLHERVLAGYVQAFRDRYPIVANKLTPSSEPADRVAAPNVVDGEALLRDHTDGGIDWSAGLPPQGAARTTAIALLEELRDAMDSLGDVSIAESVYQLVQGNHTRAGGLLDAISRAERPPEPDVVQTRAAGTEVIHRLMILMTGSPARSANWAGGTAALPRAQGEPRLDAWLSGVLPRPDKVRSSVTYVTQTNVVGAVDVRLSELGVGPLDVLALSHAGDEPGASELEQRVLYRALEEAPAGAKSFKLSFEPAQGWTDDEVSFPELLVLARSLRDMIAGARALRPEDLVPRATTVDQQAALQTGNTRLATRASDLATDVDGRLTKLTDALTGFNPASPQTVTALRDRLFQASFVGVPGAIPAIRTSTNPAELAQLEEQAQAAVSELARRKQAAAAIQVPASPPEDVRDRLVERMQALLGADFAVLPDFAPPDGQELQSAFGQSATLVAADPDAPSRWYQQLTHVRPAVARHDAVRTAVWLSGRGRPSPLTLGQLPAQQGDRWLGLPLDATSPPSGGRVALAAELPLGYQPNAAHAGLLLDAWPETIPSPDVTTGVAFHHDQPGARAPHSLLLAVSPDSRTSWDHDLLLEIVGEAIDLARIRAVDLETLDEVGQLIPPLYFAFNPDGQTVSGIADWIN